MPAIYDLAPEAPIDLPIIDGRAPMRTGEAVIGTSSADAFGMGIGDRVSVEGSIFEPDSVEIVGTAVLPTVGLFQADRTGLGTGIFIVPASARSPLNPNSEAFTGISLRAGVDGSDFMDDISDQVPTWSPFGAPQLIYRSAVRPPEIVNVSDMRSAPLVLGGVLAVSLLVGLALSLAVSVRERRREFAILRTLGFSGRSLYGSVAWQVISMVVIGLIVGVPLGVIAGRYAWRRFADQLGVVPRAGVSMLTVTAIAAAAIVLAVVAAALPARTAARVAPGDALREPS
jgi:hypothetical protein